MSKTAIVIFAFNRPKHLSQTLNRLSLCPEVDNYKHVFFIDGPRNQGDHKAVSDVLEEVNAYHCTHKEIITSTSNKGLKESVITGLNKVFEVFDQAIVLEDDICVNNDFLAYHANCLQVYKNDSRIWSISGYVVAHVGLHIYNLYGEQLYLTQRASSWGWSTWSDRWAQAKWDNASVYQSLDQGNNLWKYHKTGGDKLRLMLRMLLHKNSSWAIIWDYYQCLHQKYTVYPVSSFVENIGQDNSGTHKFKATNSDSIKQHIAITHIPQMLEPIAEVMRIYRYLNTKTLRNLLNIAMWARVKWNYRK